MKNSLLFGAIGLVAAGAMFAFGLAAGTGAGAPTSRPATISVSEAQNADRAAVEKIIREYLVAEPEILLDVQAALERKAQQQQRLAQGSVIADQAEGLFLAGTDGVLGNPDGDVTIVEFFDYNCGYCKRALADMEAMIDEDPQLRFVLKEFPILGPDSQRAHIVSMAFKSLHPDLYAEFHRRLLSSSERVDEGSAVDLALELGAEPDALSAAMSRTDLNEALALNYELANLLSITGTPSYVVGDEVVFGALGQETLSTKIANYRKCQSTQC